MYKKNLFCKIVLETREHTSRTTMTIITAVKKDNEIAIACDTQSSSGNISLKSTAEYKVNHIKLIPYGDSLFGLSGSIAISQIFEDLLTQIEPVPLTSRSEIFRWLLSHQDTLKNKYYLKPDVPNDKQQPAESQGLHALLANPYGIFSLHRYREVVEYHKFWAIGSGSHFALGALDILYDQTLTASEIAQEAALTATKFSPTCAPPIHVETIQRVETHSKAKTTKRKRSTKKKKA